MVTVSGVTQFWTSFIGGEIYLGIFTANHRIANGKDRNKMEI